MFCLQPLLYTFPAPVNNGEKVINIKDWRYFSSHRYSLIISYIHWNYYHLSLCNLLCCHPTLSLQCSPFFDQKCFMYRVIFSTSHLYLPIPHGGSGWTCTDELQFAQFDHSKSSLLYTKPSSHNLNVLTTGSHIHITSSFLPETRTSTFSSVYFGTAEKYSAPISCNKTHAFRNIRYLWYVKM